MTASSDQRERGRETWNSDSPNWKDSVNSENTEYAAPKGKMGKWRFIGEKDALMVTKLVYGRARTRTRIF